MSVTEAPDGIRIGTDSDGRLPMKNFDEYVLQPDIGELAAGATKVCDLGEAPTFRAGQNILATLYDPSAANSADLLIMHCWYTSDGEFDPATIRLRVKNVGTSTIDFGSPQVTVGGWNTTSLS